MARPVDPDLRPRLLENIITYVQDHGVTTFSLRPLAAAIGTSHRTILYHFGSREQVLCTVFDTMREAATAEITARLPAQGDPRLIFRALWRHLAAPQRRATLRLFYEMYAIATRDPERFGDYTRRTAQFWLDTIQARFRNAGEAPERARLLAGMTVAMFRGATLELAATDDVERLTGVVDAFLDLLPLAGDAP
ncbi:putative transcriptional regulator, TetR family [Gluconacetobacter diazotrophicus PA1 5]|uniref:TetR family transcriptional regulator n=1 Tax=Gluconacetobacter diazotrophicus TaxID=33996 RepID=UPI000173CD00|nr:TetR family transcriptional regulator [Gluconacetobacter diazotrophicus]ACI51249.1 putative transcriptional regulator, TetR family [Gluconacetobacter diazotrophicus PA1 5]TWB09797.1 TetR family transcriptional regulator [Gluconacetobacter diazotrophicus]